MTKFIRELRRREVFRTAGLYVGVWWILINGGSVFLPALGAPEWLFRGAIIAAFAGFPVMLVLAWFFDVNKEGISLQTDTADKDLSARKSDFVIIGVLVVALVLSLSLNLTKQTPTVVELEPVSVLVADFENTANDPLFDHVLEQALVVGLEVAPHITAFDRSTADQINPDGLSPGLNMESARQFAQRESIKLLLVGSLQQSGDGYRITVEGIDVADGRSTFKMNEKANSRDTVLQAIGKLSAKARKELDDTTSSDDQDGQAQAQTFVTTSLEAAHAYASARQLHSARKLDEAVNHYEQAIVADGNFGRAFSGLAFAEFSLGQTDEAAAHWTKALSLMDTMTQRERLRALCRYHTVVANDGNTAEKVCSEFVEKYPADIGGRELYASASLLQGNFATAVKETRKIVQLFPAAYQHRTKLALYAMYAGDWDMATTEAKRVITANPEYGTAYLPMAIAALAEGETDTARDVYTRMALAGKTEHDASVAELGMADIDLYFGQIDAAQERLRTGIETDTDSGNDRMAALKYIALAQSFAEQDNFPAATTAVAKALSLTDDNSLKVAAATIYIHSGDLASATAIVDALTKQPDAHSRAYGQMLKGMILERDGAQIKAIYAMRDAIAIADLWLIRLQTGKSYLRAGNYLEALDELTMLKVRQGEATAAFLDDIPTYRLLAELPYWIGRVQENLKNPSAARASYEKYVSLRPQGGALAQDASERAARLD